MSTTTLAVLVPLLPFLGAFAGLAAGRRAPGFVRPLAVLPTLAAAALAVVVAVKQSGGDTAVTAATQLTPTGNELLPISLAFHLDGFAVLVAVLVGVVASCVQLYSTGYLRDDPRYASYASLVSLFTEATPFLMSLVSCLMEPVSPFRDCSSPSICFNWLIRSSILLS